MPNYKMKVDRRGYLNKLAGGGVMLGLAGCLGGGQSEDYPEQSLTCIIPFGQGGGTDTYVRQLTPVMSEKIGGDIIPENVTGAASLRGVGRLFNSDPDGYTFGAFNVPSTPIAYLVESPEWDITEFVGVCSYAYSPYTLIVDPDLGIQNLQELKEQYNNTEIENIAGPGTGGIGEIVSILIEEEWDINYGEYVAYEGSGPTVQAIISGEVPVGIVTDSAALPAVESNDIEVIVIIPDVESRVFPDIPTAPEEGFANIDYASLLLRCMWLPPETPSDRRDILEQGMKEAIQDDEIQSWSEETGNIVEFGDHNEAEQILTDSLEELNERIDFDSLTVE